MPPPAAVLFACNLNRVRSPMAAALMRRLYGEAVRVESCGIEPADAVDPFVVAVMAELEVDLSDYEPKDFDSVQALPVNVVIALTPESHELARLTFGEATVQGWAVSDPTGAEGSREQRLDAYRATRAELERKLREYFGPPSNVAPG